LQFFVSSKLLPVISGLQKYNLFCNLQIFLKIFFKLIFFVEESSKEQGDKSTTVFETTKSFLKIFSGGILNCCDR